MLPQAVMARSLETSMAELNEGWVLQLEAIAKSLDGGNG